LNLSTKTHTPARAGWRLEPRTMNLFRRHPAPHDHDDPRYEVRKSDEQWRAELDPMQYQVARQAATERAFTGKY
jgi:peptide-methionine (R)-S-oxide reductase